MYQSNVNIMSGLQIKLTNGFYTYNGIGKWVFHCVQNVSTHTMDGITSGLVNVFRSKDCTGVYQTIKGLVETMEWMNSVSFGPSGSSRGPNGCPSSYSPI